MIFAMTRTVMCPRPLRGAGAWALAAYLALGACGSVSGHRWKVTAEEATGPEMARRAGLAGAAAWAARGLELEGRYTEAVAAWLEAPPSAWRTARVRRLVALVTPRADLIAALVRDGAAVAVAGSEAAGAAGDAAMAITADAAAGAIERVTVDFGSLAQGVRPVELSLLGGEVPRFGGDEEPHTLGLPADTIEDAPAQLVLFGPGPYRVTAGGTPLLETPAEGFPNPRWARVAVPAGAGEVRIERGARARGPAPLRVFLQPPPAEAMEVVSSAVEAVEVALGDGDLDRAAHHAEHLKDRLDDAAAAARVALALAEIDAAGPGREHEALARALGPGAPTRPPGLRAEIAALQVALDAHEEAARMLETLEPGDPAALLSRLELADLAGDRGQLRNLLAAALEPATAPLPCALRRRVAEHANATLDPHLPLRPLPGTPGVGGTCALAEAELIAAQKGRDDAVGTRAALEDLLRTTPPGSGGPRAGICLLVARSALAMGDEPGAREALGCAVAEGDPGGRAAALRSALGARHRSAEQVRAAGAPPDDPDHLLAGPSSPNGLMEAAPLLREALGAPRSAYFEIVWNERLDHVTSRGAVHSRQHTLMCFQDADATARFGEIPIPAAASMVLARTWKVHTTAGSPTVLQPISPEETPVAEEVVSLAALEPGDCAELLWLERRSGAASDAFETPPFFFDDPRGPTRAARWILDAPASTAPIIAGGDGLNGTGFGDEVVRDGRRVTIMRHDLPPFVAEPQDTRSDLRRVSVRARGVRWDPDAPIAAARASTAAALTPAPPELRRLLADATRADASLALPTVLAAVQKAIPEDHGEARDGDLVPALRTGRGSRALALAAALHALGRPFALLLARPLHEAGPGATLGEVDAFSWPVVETVEAGQMVLVDPRAADGTAQPLVRGADAIVLAEAPAQGGERRTTPTPPAGQRRVAWTVSVEPGELRARVEAVERLTGVFAAAWRELLAKIPSANHGLLLAHVTAASFPDASDATHTLAGLGPSDAALEWRAAATLQLRPLSPERVELTVALAPDEPLAQVGELPRRRAPLFFNMSADTELRMCVTLPSGWRVMSPPEAVQIAAAGFEFSRMARADVDGCALVVEKRWRTAPRWVTPSDFPAFIEAAFAVQRADGIRIVLSASPRPRAD